MGDQKDVLEGMTKFSGNDGAVVWPMWKDDLMNRVKFELGTVAVRILEGKIRKDQVKVGVRIKAIQSLGGAEQRWHRCEALPARASFFKFARQSATCKAMLEGFAANSLPPAQQRPVACYRYWHWLQ